MAGKVLSASKRPIRQLSIREKIAAIDRVHSGESKASVARDIGVPESTLRGWCKSEDKLRVVARTCGTPDSDGDKEEHQPLNMTTSQPQHTAPPPQPLVTSNITPKSQPEVNEALWFWLKQQQQVSLGSPLLDPKLASLDKDGSSWFWRWYKNFGYSQFPDNGPLSASNARSMLDNAMLNVNDNNNVMTKKREEDANFSAKRKDEDYNVKRRTEAPEESNTRKRIEEESNNANKRKLEESEDDDEDEPPATPAEAVSHGEKFLRWLECCSDPSVTAMQILQFRYLLNNVRACANRRAKQGKTKAARK